MTVAYAVALGFVLMLPAAVLCARSFSWPWPAWIQRPLGWLSVRYLWVVAAVFVWLESSVLLAGLRPHHVIESTTLLAIATIAAVAARWYPLSCALAYALISYTFGRDDTVTTTFVNLGATSMFAWLSLLALAAWARRQPEPVAIGRGVLPWSAALFFAWMGVAVLVTTMSDRPVTDNVTWRAARNIQCAILFFVAANYSAKVREIRIVLLVTGMALIVRQVFLTSYWLFEQNLAMLAVVIAPVSFALALSKPWDIVQVPLAATSMYLGGMVLFIRNRGAVVGLAAACLGLWPLARRRWTLLPALVAVPAAVAFWADRAGLLHRFYTIYQDGRFLGSAAERINVWTHGLAIAQGHWLTGVGPGNFEWAIDTRTGGSIGLTAHNSYVELFVEAGAPALILYLAVFVAAVVTLAGVSRTFRSSWPRTAAAGILGSVAAHLAAGIFLSNPSLAWTWMLLGLAVMLRGGVQPPEIAAAGERR